MAKASKAWYSKGSKGLFSKAGKSVKSGVSYFVFDNSPPYSSFIYSVLITSLFAHFTDDL